MTITEFFRRLLWHITTAATTLFVVLLIGEYFVPGSVLPFVDLVDFTIVIIGLLVLNVMVLPLAKGELEGVPPTARFNQK